MLLLKLLGGGKCSGCIVIGTRIVSSLFKDFPSSLFILALTCFGIGILYPLPLGTTRTRPAPMVMAAWISQFMFEWVTDACSKAGPLSTSR